MPTPRLSAKEIDPALRRTAKRAVNLPSKCASRVSEVCYIDHSEMEALAKRSLARISHHLHSGTEELVMNAMDSRVRSSFGARRHNNAMSRSSPAGMKLEMAEKTRVHDRFRQRSEKCGLGRRA